MASNETTATSDSVPMRESVVGRLVAAAIGVAAVFYLTFASNSVEHASAEVEKAKVSLPPDQLVAAYQAMTAAGEAGARERYFTADALVHPAAELGCDAGAVVSPAFDETGGELVISQRWLSLHGSPSPSVEVYRVKDSKIVEYWHFAVDMAGCEREE